MLFMWSFKVKMFIESETKKVKLCDSFNDGFIDCEVSYLLI